MTYVFNYNNPALRDRDWDWDGDLDWLQFFRNEVEKPSLKSPFIVKLIMRMSY